MSPGTAEALALAGGGLLASEATGITDVTPVGRSSDGQGPQRPRIPTPGTPPTQLPPGLNLGELFSSFATPADVAAAFQAGAGAGGQGVGSDALIRAFNAGATTVRDTTNQNGQRVPTVTEIVDLIDERTPRPGPGPGPNDNDRAPTGSGEDEFKLQDLDGRGPSGIGTWLAATGESGVAVGETVGAVGNAVGSPGRPSPGEEDSFFGRIYQAGATTGEAINEGRDAYGRANDRYRDATKGARETVETAKDVTRPWRWDVDTPDLGGLSPVGTVSADSDAGDSDTSSSETSGGRSSNYTPSSREVPTRPTRSGPTAGSSSSDDYEISLPDDVKRQVDESGNSSETVGFTR